MTSRPVAGAGLLEGLPAEPCFYFVHSYYRPGDPAAQAARTSYGVDFVSAVSDASVTAFQFHPEKSQSAGLELLRRFAVEGVSTGVRIRRFAAGAAK